MKKIKMAKAVGLADEKFVAEAAPKVTKKGVWRKFTLAAACAVLALLIVGVAVILPLSLRETDYKVNKNRLPGVLRPYANSEYLDVMIAFYEYDKRIEAQNRRNFWKNFGNTLRGGMMMGDANIDGSDLGASAPGGAEANGYVETTDNQVQGVIEYDLLKRTKTHAFYLDANRMVLEVYSICGENSSLVSSYDLSREKREDVFIDDRAMGLFLSSDGNTLTLIGTVYEYTKAEDRAAAVNYVYLKSLDVSDPENIRENKSVNIMGDHISARLTDGKILLMSKYSVGKTDYDDLNTFLPLVDTGAGFEPISADSIILPEELTAKRYMLVSQIDEKSLEIDGMAAALCYDEELYVSSENIFLTRAFRDTREIEDDGVKLKETADVTELFAISYGGEGFEQIGGICIDGFVKDQYSMDEYEGVLRVVTTTDATRTYAKGSSSAKPSALPKNSNAALYCIDISEWKVIAEVKDFAPWGESVESVRFDGTKAYVCTAEVVTFTDPVYFFDLSDMNNITYTDTGVIEGYSSSLVDFGEGYLLGIGFGENRETLKIEIYEENNGKVESVCEYVREGVDFATDYKSYYIDRERGWVGIGYYDYYAGLNSPYRYVLLAFNGTDFTELICEKEAFTNGSCNDFRAFLDGDHFYIFKGDEYKVVKLD